MLYTASGKQGEALKILNQLKSSTHPDPFEVALLSVSMGDKEQAFAWLEKAYTEHAGQLVMTLKVEPAFDPLRSDPRFNHLLSRIGLPL